MGGPVVFLSEHRDRDDGTASEFIRTPGARLIACDPVSFVDATSMGAQVEAAGRLFAPSALEPLDVREIQRLRGLEGQGPVEPLTGRKTGYLMARALLFRALPFAKSLAVAESVLQGADSVILVGESAAPTGRAYPSEFHDLYGIAEAVARDRGLECRRVSRPPPGRVERPNRSLMPIATRILSSLLRVRARRVLTVELYPGVRTRLSTLMPGVEILPFMAPAAPSRGDLEGASRLSEAFGGVSDSSAADTAEPSVAELRSKAMRDAIMWELPRVMARARAMAAVVHSYHPHVVVLMEDASPSGRALAAVARRGGAWTVVVQHGLVGEDLGGTHVMPCVANVHFAWGPYAADWNYAHGAPEGSQSVVGNPMLDNAFSEGWGTREDVVPREVVFASQPFVGVSSLESDFDRMETIRALQPFDSEGVTVVLRPHPADDVASLRRLVHGLGFNSVQWDATLAASLARPAVMLTKTSTVALEAMLRSRPVVLAVLSGRGDRTGLTAHGAALLATTPEEVTERVRACMEDASVRRRLAEGRAKLLPEYLDGMDGGATRRLAEHLADHVSVSGR